MDVITNHLITHIFDKKTMKDMFDALVILYQSKNINRKMILHNKFRSVEMTRLESYQLLMKDTNL